MGEVTAFPSARLEASLEARGSTAADMLADAAELLALGPDARLGYARLLGVLNLLLVHWFGPDGAGDMLARASVEARRLDQPEPPRPAA